MSETENDDAELGTGITRTVLLSGLQQLAKWGESDDEIESWSAATSAKMSIDYVAMEASGQAFLDEFGTEAEA